MTEEKSGGGAVAAPIGGFRVELKPGETTIVSWKKLLKEYAAKQAAAAGAVSTSEAVVVPVQAAQPVNVNPALESRLAPPGQPAENELKDGHPSRFGAVIEKIERLYMGKHSSDEEDLNDVPDDDEYDTEDSFIDDAELDDYFQVDNSAIKHDGFFVNRGKLERINEPAALPNPQPKKRRRKDLAKSQSDSDNVELPNKLVKVGSKVGEKSKKLVARKVGLPHVVALPSVHNEEMKFQNQSNTSAVHAKKRSMETKSSLNPSTSSIANSDAALSLAGNTEKRIPEMVLSKPQGNKLKDGVETANACRSKSDSAKRKSETAILAIGNGELDRSVQVREKEGNRVRPDLDVSAGKVPMQNSKTTVMQRKEGSSIKTKNTNLEKNIRELGKMVAESRPPSTEAPDADMASPAIKRRLPRPLKQKLAKVARLAQASHGRISKELINRLMSILGHLVQERTLKKNLKDMVASGLTEKKEKEDKVQQMKKDVAELIQRRIPFIKSKVLEQQAGGSNDFQEMGNEEKEIIKRKYGMDNTIEDKICDLYDRYVDGLDEEAGPQARRLYAELAQLWPDGLMDNHGIKRAVCRAKDRKRARSKDQEKIKQKKLVQKTEGTAPIDTNAIAQPQHMQEKSVSQSSNHVVSSLNQSVFSTTSANSIGVASSAAKVSNPDRPKQDKVKAKASSINLNERVPADGLVKKKLKKKPEAEMAGGQIPVKKSAAGVEKSKSQSKQDVTLVQKPTLPPSVAADSETAKTAASPPINLNDPADMR